MPICNEYRGLENTHQYTPLHRPTACLQQAVSRQKLAQRPPSRWGCLILGCGIVLGDNHDRMKNLGSTLTHNAGPYTSPGHAPARHLAGHGKDGMDAHKI